VDAEIIAFDVFGTLVDWRSGVSSELARAGDRAGLTADWPAVADAWRSRYRPTLDRVIRGELPFGTFDTLHRMTLDEVVEEHGLQALTGADRAELVRAWRRLPPWPDVVPGLAALRERHIVTPLSNGGLGLLTRLARAAGLTFDCILSTELARTYKPDPRAYRLVPGYFEVPPERVLMVACHPYDLEAAAREGMRTAYVPRPLEWGTGTSVPAAPPGTDVVAGDLVALASRL